MKKVFKIFTIFFAVVFLCSCSKYDGIGDKAIVKGVIINYEKEKYEASIVVLTCKPSSQISEIREEANIYSGKGKTIQEAISNAEKLQNKTPFYAQNELLFISEKAVDEKLYDISKYFLREDISRPGLSVFVTKKNIEDFEKASKILPDIIRSAERGNKPLSKNALKITQLKFNDEDKFNGYLPKFTFEKDINKFYGIENLAVYKNSKKQFDISQNDMIYTLLLSNKLKSMQLNLFNEESLAINADGLLLSYFVDDNFNLKISLTGNIRNLQKNDEDIKNKTEAKRLCVSVNKAITEKCQKLILESFDKQNDIFNFSWWFEAKNASKYLELIKDNSLYQNNRVEFVSNLKIV